MFNRRIKAFLANLLKIIILFVKKYAARKHIIFRAVVLGATFQFRNFSAVSEKLFRFLKPQYSRNLRAQSILLYKWLTIVVAKADLVTSEHAILHLQQTDFAQCLSILCHLDNIILIITIYFLYIYIYNVQIEINVTDKIYLKNMDAGRYPRRYFCFQS